MRVIAGSARSLKLVTPRSDATRPTTDRIKETLFNMLQFDLADAAFLDLFAGSGGIGIEALSRGAKRCVFVDSDKEAGICITQNLEHTRLADKGEYLRQDTFVALQMLEYKETFDIVFMDPPYGQELERRVLEYLTMSTIVNADSLIIFEADIKTDISYLDALGYDLVKEKIYKTNKHVFVRRKR